MYKLLIQNGDRKGYVHRLGLEAITIGRDPMNTIILSDQNVSRFHIRIFYESESYIVEDMGSTNGTYINSEQIDNQILNLHDQITIGNINILFLNVNETDSDFLREDILAKHVCLDDRDFTGFTIECSVIPDKVTPLNIYDKQCEDENIKKSYERLKTLYKLNHDLGALDELNKLLNKVLILILDITNADRGFILILNNDNNDFIPQYTIKRKGLVDSSQIPVSRSIINHIIKTHESLLITDTSIDDKFQKAESVIIHNIRSVMCVPLKSKNNLLGVIQVDTKGDKNRFNRDDLELLTAVSEEISLAIENAQIFQDLNQAYNDLKQKQLQLIESEKISALGQMASGIVHEIKNPLTSIIGYSEMSCLELKKNNLNSDIAKKCIDFMNIVKDQGKRCQKITESILNVARRKTPAKKETYINGIVESALAIAHYHFKKGNIQIVKYFDKDIPPIMVDENQIHQVFLNLIINAKDSMEKGGILTINTKKEENNYIMITFSDTGCGIPDDKIDKIFQPLFTTKETGKGTGLGLSISQEIIENHKGSISVKSDLNKGTEFIIKLPINIEP